MSSLTPLKEMSLNVDMVSGHVQRHCSEKLWQIDAPEWDNAESFVIDSPLLIFAPQLRELTGPDNRS